MAYEKCEYCKSTILTEQELVIRGLFPESNVEQENNLFYVDYDRSGQSYAVVRLVFRYAFEQWIVSEAYISTPDFEAKLNTPQKYFKDPWEAFKDAKKSWERDVED